METYAKSCRKAKLEIWDVPISSAEEGMYDPHDKTSRDVSGEVGRD
jgi:hypothetical protein